MRNRLSSYRSSLGRWWALTASSTASGCRSKALATSLSSPSASGSCRPTHTKSPGPRCLGARPPRSVTWHSTGDAHALAVERVVDDHGSRLAADRSARCAPVPALGSPMATVILVRHGRTTRQRLGRAGRAHARRPARRHRHGAGRAGRAPGWRGVPLAAVVTSPLERCRQTARASSRAPAGGTAGRPPSAGLTECDYGDWQGRPLKELAKEKLWKVVQTQPSAAVFPGGESMAAMQARVGRRRTPPRRGGRGRARPRRRLGGGQPRRPRSSRCWPTRSACTSTSSSGSTSTRRRSRSCATPPTRPYVLATNTHDGDLSWLAPPPAKKRRAPAAAGGRRRRRGRRTRRPAAP